MDRILSMMGLARKAGQLVSGEFATEKAVKEGKARLVIIASDASENTKKLFFDKCRSYSVPLRVYSDKESIGRALGLRYRASAAVTDQGFSESLLGKIDGLLQEERGTHDPDL